MKTYFPNHTLSTINANLSQKKSTQLLCIHHILTKNKLKSCRILWKNKIMTQRKILEMGLKNVLSHSFAYTRTNTFWGIIWPNLPKPDEKYATVQTNDAAFLHKLKCYVRKKLYPSLFRMNLKSLTVLK